MSRGSAFSRRPPWGSNWSGHGRPWGWGWGCGGSWGWGWDWGGGGGFRSPPPCPPISPPEPAPATLSTEDLEWYRTDIRPRILALGLGAGIISQQEHDAAAASPTPAPPVADHKATTPVEPSVTVTAPSTVVPASDAKTEDVADAAAAEHALGDTDHFEDVERLRSLDLVCAVCTNALCRPQELEPCAHLFCESCLARLPKRACPVCKQAIQSSRPSKIAQRQLHDWPVRCPRSPTCTWTGKFHTLAKHVSTPHDAPDVAAAS